MILYKKQNLLFFKIAMLFAFFISLFSFSQEQSSVDSIAVEKTIFVELADIVEQIEDSDIELKRINNKVKLPSSVAEIDSLLPGYIEFLAAEKKYVDDFIKEEPNKQKINYLTNRWENYIFHIEKWEKTISGYENDYEYFLDEIAAMKQTWQLTYDNAKKEKAPLDIVSEIENLLNNIKNTEKSIFKEKNKLLSLEAKINREKRKSTDVINKLFNLKKSDTYNLLYKRHLPIWEESFELSKKANSGVSESIPKKIALIFKTIKKDVGLFYWYLFTVLLILLLVNHLKKAFVKYTFNEENRYLQQSKNTLLNHSREVVVFLSIFIARFFFIEVPLLFLHITILLLLLVSIPLLKPVIYTRFKKIVYIVVVLFLIDSIKSYVWFDSLLYRFYLI